MMWYSTLTVVTLSALAFSLLWALLDSRWLDAGQLLVAWLLAVKIADRLQWRLEEERAEILS